MKYPPSVEKQSQQNDANIFLTQIRTTNAQKSLIHSEEEEEPFSFNYVTSP